MQAIGCKIVVLLNVKVFCLELYYLFVADASLLRSSLSSEVNIIVFNLVAQFMLMLTTIKW